MPVNLSASVGPVPSSMLRRRLRAADGELSESELLLHRIEAGRNNAVFEATDDDGSVFVVKVLRDPVRAMREVWSLGQLQASEPTLVPRVFDVMVAPSGAVVVLMERLEGLSLDDRPLSASHVHSVVEAIGRIHATRPAVRWNAHRDLADMVAHVDQLTATSTGTDLDVIGRWERFRDGPLAEELRAEPRLVFGRGDPNLQNVIETTGGLRFVDFEYAGMTDEIYAYADVAAHVRSRATSLSAWRAGVDHLLHGATDRRRFDRCLSLFAFFWYLRLVAIDADQDLVGWALDRLDETSSEP